MRQSVPRGNKKRRVVQPVTVTTNSFTPKISERTKQRRKLAKERQLQPSKFASGLDTCGVVCLYMFLILAVIIGGGGIGLCAYYLSQDQTDQGWKIAGIVFGIITCIVGAILILLTIFKQKRNKPWKYKKEEHLYNAYEDMDDDGVEANIEDFDDNEKQDSVIIHQGSLDEGNVSQSGIIHPSSDGKTRETASSPIADPSLPPLHLKTITSDLIFCPGCNRSHPSSHQCMYSTHIANSLPTQFRSTSQAPQQDSIAIQTEDDGKKRKKTGPHTVIDRTLKYSNTTETQTDTSANSKPNITESIILRRVPIPTAKVVVQQPTTKVMIVKVPNVPGQLVIQHKTTTPPTDEQPK